MERRLNFNSASLYAKLLDKPMKCRNKCMERKNYPIHWLFNDLSVFRLECFQDLTRILNNDIPCARQKQLRKFVSLWLLIANWLFEYSPVKYTFPRRKTGRFVERNKMWGCRSDLENRDVHIKKHSEKSPLRLFKNLFRRAQKCPTTSGNFFEIQ